MTRTTRDRARTHTAAAAALAACVLCLGCGDSDPNMRRQPRYRAFDASASFIDGASARPLVPGTVPRDAPAAPPGRPPQPPTTMALLLRGQERFDIFCSMCHGRDAYGRGMVVQRGFPEPPSLHAADIRAKPDEHYYQVIAEGLGKMPPYGRMVGPDDAWAVIAYIRALQLSQHASPDDVPPDHRSALEPHGPEGAP
ncbi:MAG: cytochrome c [Phycisphaerales bacterium]|nr:cytochrome c [Phycisphaerales bacterium]